MRLQRLDRGKVRRILDEQEKLKLQLKNKNNRLESWSKELNKREALTERERQKLDEEKKKVIYVKVKFPAILQYSSIRSLTLFFISISLYICVAYVTAPRSMWDK